MSVTASKTTVKKKAVSASQEPVKAKRAVRKGEVVTPEERYRMIAESAYYRAEARGFEGGDPSHDWVEAEAEIDAALGKTH